MQQVVIYTRKDMIAMGGAEAMKIMTSGKPYIIVHEDATKEVIEFTASVQFKTMNARREDVEFISASTGKPVDIRLTEIQMVPR